MEFPIECYISDFAEENFLFLDPGSKEDQLFLVIDDEGVGMCGGLVWNGLGNLDGLSFEGVLVLIFDVVLIDVS